MTMYLNFKNMKMKNFKHLLLLLVLLLSVGISESIAYKNIEKSPMKKAAVESVMAGCNPAKTQTQFDINNVRTTILTGGDMWWNLISARYEIPKGGGAHSLFSGSMWIGGIDNGSNLRVAAMTYRQNGNDFWPGPLDTQSVSITPAMCELYDKHYVVTRKEVEDFVNQVSTTIPNSIITWPGNGNTSIGQAKYLAPFFDKDGNGFYDPAAGDYPKYSLDSKVFSCDERQIFGDKTLWWVFNDMGNTHTESDGNSIGLEIRAQAFAFTSTDEINNMTFYDYEIINRSSNQLNKTYFGVWVDADLGFFSDDYVGCDVANGIGYCYNGNPVDGTGALGTYGTNPPAIGVDFFRGPKVADPLDGINGLVSYVEPSGRISMSKFIYYNNDFTVTGNPVKATDYYGYLSGLWKDGTPFTYGGNAKGGTVLCDFMFPGDSDPNGKGTQNVPQSPWSEATVGNLPADRRFIQSAGPFTLKPGAVNNVTIGCVWARATQGGPLASVQLMRDADVKAQALFNSCFKITNGPDAPDLTIQELDQQLIVYLSNKATSNNYKDSYQERDSYITYSADSLYHFEGYQVYQIVDSSVAVTDLSNPDKARLVFQSDLKNGVAQIVNYYKDQSLGGAWVPKEMVNGADKGVSRSFTVTKDAFTDEKLVNHQQYYYMAISYGYNAAETSADPYNRADGFNLAYISGRRNIKAYVAIPHIISPEFNGTETHSNYGDGVFLTRIEGQGNAGRVLDLTEQSVTNILNAADSRYVGITYEKGKGPIDIKVIDPLNVPEGCYTIAITDSVSAGRWILKNALTGAIIAKSDTSILANNEQIIPELGISVKASYVYDIGFKNTPGDGGILEATMTFADPTKNWLTAVADFDVTEGSAANLNWIRSGKFQATPPASSIFDDYTYGVDSLGAPIFMDANQYFEKILGGTWAPYRMCATSDISLTAVGGPAYRSYVALNDMKRSLASVDVVLTADKSKWTRCPVIEMAEETVFAEGAAKKHDLRAAPSVDKNGVKGDGITVSTNPNDPGYLAATGMGWFPGYAINIETGERLNMAFGEDSQLATNNGRDMIWNPTSTYWGTNSFPIFGGKHYIYIFAHATDFTSPPGGFPTLSGRIPRYDGGLAVWQLLNAKNDQTRRIVYSDAMWVNIPLLATGHKLLETDVKVRIRVARKFRRGFSAILGSTALLQDVADTASPSVNNNFPMYSFCTNGLETHKGQIDIAKQALDIINIVPNPYYAYSGYEASQSDNRVKITNLPQKCSIRIYTVNGLLVRTLRKDEPKTSLDWDLQNQSKIPIASGLYIIHVDVPGVGEKTLKWFGVMRPIDLDSY